MTVLRGMTIMLSAWLLLVAVATPAQHSWDVPNLRVVNRPEVEWGGRYMRWDDERPTIVLNVAPGRNAHGLAWTLRHELGHAQADRLGLPASERYANDVADGRVALVWPTVAAVLRADDSR